MTNMLTCNYVYMHSTRSFFTQFRALHGRLTRYAKLWVAHAPGMPVTVSLPPRVSDPDMHHDTCVTLVPWCMPGSLTSGFLQSRWQGKRSRDSRRMRNPKFCVSGKRPIVNHHRDGLSSSFFLASYWIAQSVCERAFHLLKQDIVISPELGWLISSSGVMCWLLANQWENRLFAQIPQCASFMSHNAPYCNKNVYMCANLCYKMLHCGIFVWCMVVFLRCVYSNFAWSYQGRT